MKITKNNIVDYRTQDFLEDESYIEWMRSGKPTHNIWTTRLKQHPELLDEARKAEEILERLNFSEPAAPSYRIDRIKRNLDSKIDDLPRAVEKLTFHSSITEPKPENKKGLFVRLIAIAAVVSLVIVSVLIFRPETQNPVDIAVLTKETGKGQKLTVHLSDGSTVKINSMSSISYNEFFTDSSRVLYLTGEAFFDVARDSLRPFKVITKNITTTALGTSFNIKSMKSGYSTTVFLESGKVSVENTEVADYEKVFLEPGQQAFSTKEQSIKIQPFDPDNLVWKDGILVFNKDSYQEVFEKLGNWYGVKFHINGHEDTNINWDYTGRFKNETLRNVLKSIAYVKKFSFELEKEEVVVDVSPSTNERR